MVLYGREKKYWFFFLKQLREFWASSLYGANRLNSNQNSKNGILLPMDTSKESNFYADFKYTSFIKFSPTPDVTSLRKFALFSKKEGNIPLKVIKS